jgi:hypothetical protein
VVVVEEGNDDVEEVLGRRADALVVALVPVFEVQLVQDLWLQEQDQLSSEESHHSSWVERRHPP